ncbi:hypothetical protein HDU87_001435 [Geranomyces variabilis]|uniref:Transmembrane protein n=1 Tax=Geranomyces variabilis TaxID=109894 RepID=A0AAD5XI55_9FUNG|nr:hypothetical protein HDU87_001435 [Geranomyces variabilis]
MTTQQDLDRADEYLKDIRSRHPRRWWDLTFVESELEEAFWANFAQQVLDKNTWVTLVGSITYALYAIILVIGSPVEISTVMIPVVIFGSALSFVFFIVLSMMKYVAPTRPDLLRLQNHIAGLFATGISWTQLIALEYVFAPVKLIEDRQVFCSHIVHQSLCELYIAISATYTGFRWSVFCATTSVIGNYAMLTWSLNANPMRFMTQIAAYGMCAISGLIEAYLLEGKARDVFLMERIVSESSSMRFGSVQQEQTKDLLSRARLGHERREDQNQLMSGDPVNESLPTHWEAPELADEESITGAPRNSLAGAARTLEKILERRGVKDSEPPDTLNEGKTPVIGGTANSKRHPNWRPRVPKVVLPRPIRRLFKRWWKRIYLAWPNPYHEQRYLKWQDKTFGRVYGLAIILQTISVVSHIFLDKRSFCKPTVEGVDSTFICRDPGPVTLERTYIFYFIPVLSLALLVSLGPWLKVHPSVTHACAVCAFMALFGGYVWLAASVFSMYQGSQIVDDSFEAFESYAYNVLIAAGGSSALPSHLYQLLLFAALASSVTALAMGIPIPVALYDIPLLMALSSTAGVQVTTAERLARRHHALEQFFLERYMETAGRKQRKSTVCFPKKLLQSVVLSRGKSSSNLVKASREDDDSATDPSLVLLTNQDGIEQSV